MVLAMSEEQLKAAEAEAKAEQEEGSGEEVSEDDLEGVAGGVGKIQKNLDNMTLGAVGCMSFIPRAFSFGA